METDYTQKKQLAEHFVGKQINDKAVLEYCNRLKIPVVPSGYVEDYIYQMDFDKRIAKVIPLILEKIALLRYIPEFISEEKRKEMSKVSENIEIDIAHIFEDNDMEFREIDYIKSLSKNIVTMLDNAHARINSEVSKVFSAVAEEKFGTPLTVKAIMSEKRNIEKKLST